MKEEEYQMEHENIKQQSQKNCRAFIASIIDQALTDALNPRLGKDCRTARSFIDEKNEMFSYYCHLIDIEPEWLAKKLCKIIREHSVKTKKELFNYTL